jgi:hypothetical protein
MYRIILHSVMIKTKIPMNAYWRLVIWHPLYFFSKKKKKY